MKRILGLTTAALMGASMFAAPVIAQEYDRGGTANAEAVTEGVDTPIYDDAVGVMPERQDLSTKEYQSGGQYNAMAADEGDVSMEYTGSIIPPERNVIPDQEYETGGMSNAEEVMPE